MIPVNAPAVPVRIPATARSYVVRDNLVLGEDHHMRHRACLVCTLPLGSSGRIALVYIGTAPQERDGPVWYGAAVPVHESCAAPRSTP